MPVGSSSTEGDHGRRRASAYWVVLQSPGVPPQLEAKLQGTLLVFTIVILPPVEVMTAVSPGWVSSTH